MRPYGKVYGHCTSLRAAGTGEALRLFMGEARGLGEFRAHRAAANDLYRLVQRDAVANRDEDGRDLRARPQCDTDDFALINKRRNAPRLVRQPFVAADEDGLRAAERRQ